MLNIYYTEAELTAANINESSLKKYYYNSTSGSWQLEANQGVNTTGDYVWANITHFSLFGLFGKEPITTNATTNATTPTTTPTDGGVPISYNIGEITEYNSIERTAKATDTISFKISGNDYILTVGTITSDSAKITLLGKTVTLSIGDYERFDVNNDDVYDLELSLESVTSGTINYVKFKFKSIYIPIEAAPEEEAPEEGAAEEGAEEGAEELGLPFGLSKPSLTWLLWASIIIVIVVIIVFLLVPRLIKRE